VGTSITRSKRATITNKLKITTKEGQQLTSKPNRNNSRSNYKWR